MSSQSPTSLQVRIARDIVTLLRREKRLIGSRIAESQIAKDMGTSRTPVKAALLWLAELGIVERDANRGYFVASDGDALATIAKQFDSSPDDPLYLLIGRERLAGLLPDEVNEAELMRRYGVARSTLRKSLARIAREGWIEDSVGHRWRFLSVIDSPAAYDESFSFRQANEVAGLLSQSFTFDVAELDELRREQQRIVDGGWSQMTSTELFDANSKFHETLARWSGNRFILDAMCRMNQLRRLVEYRQTSIREPRRTQAEEHLAILDSIARNDLLSAATLMRSHLDGARRLKSLYKQGFEPTEAS